MEKILTHLFILFKHEERGVVGGIVLVDLPALELQGEWRHVGEHLVAELHVVAGDVGHHPEGEHLRLVRSHAVPQRLVQDDLGAARVHPDQHTSMMTIRDSSEGPSEGS